MHFKCVRSAVSLGFSVSVIIFYLNVKAIGHHELDDLTYLPVRTFPVVQILVSFLLANVFRLSVMSLSPGIHSVNGVGDLLALLTVVCKRRHYLRVSALHTVSALSQILHVSFVECAAFPLLFTFGHRWSCPWYERVSISNFRIERSVGLRLPALWSRIVDTVVEYFEILEILLSLFVLCFRLLVHLNVCHHLFTLFVGVTSDHFISLCNSAKVLYFLFEFVLSGQDSFFEAGSFSKSACFNKTFLHFAQVIELSVKVLSVNFVATVLYFECISQIDEFEMSLVLKVHSLVPFGYLLIIPLCLGHHSFFRLPHTAERS